MFFIMTIIIIFVADWCIKSYIEKNCELNQSKEYKNGTICIEKHHNSGVFLNCLSDKPKLILVVTSLIIGALIGMFAFLLPKKREVLLKTAFAFVIGGASNNLLDRMKRGYVVDYLRFPKLKGIKNIIFNISDFFIFIGSILLLIAAMFGSKK